MVSSDAQIWTTDFPGLPSALDRWPPVLVRSSTRLQTAHFLTEHQPPWSSWASLTVAGDKAKGSPASPVVAPLSSVSPGALPSSVEVQWFSWKRTYYHWIPISNCTLRKKKKANIWRYCGLTCIMVFEKSLGDGYIMSLGPPWIKLMTI